MFPLDYHLHTKCSDDGDFSPETIVELCEKAHLRSIAITDHNTVRGVAAARREAEKRGLRLVPGIELDCVFRGVNLHVLGYHIDENYSDFATNEQKLLDQEIVQSAHRLKKIEAMGFVVDKAAMQKLGDAHFGVITGEDIAEVLLQTPENDENPLLLPYRAGGARSDNPLVNFYWDFCSQGKVAHMALEIISLREAVDMIRASGGVAVLAHPGINIHEDTNLLRGIMDEGLRGIEVYSSYHSPEQIRLYREFALAGKFDITCGSDFHGKIKPSIALGALDIPAEDRERLDWL